MLRMVVLFSMCIRQSQLGCLLLRARRLSILGGEGFLEMFTMPLESARRTSYTPHRTPQLDAQLPMGLLITLGHLIPERSPRMFNHWLRLQVCLTPSSGSVSCHLSVALFRFTPFDKCIMLYTPFSRAITFLDVTIF